MKDIEKIDRVLNRMKEVTETYYEVAKPLISISTKFAERVLDSISTHWIGSYGLEQSAASFTLHFSIETPYKDVVDKQQMFEEENKQQSIRRERLYSHHKFSITIYKASDGYTYYLTGSCPREVIVSVDIKFKNLFN